MSEADTLEIKKRARRRLVGAIALALLAAIVLPMMMEEEPHPSVEDIRVSIPDRDKAASARRGAAPENASAPVAVAVPEDDEVVAAEKPAPEKAPAAGDKPAPATPPAPAKSPLPPASPTAATPPRPPAPTAEPRRPSADEEARLRALIEGKASPARGDSYVLQIGAFSDAVKAARLVDELRARGFPAYTERAGNVTRVRVGPVAGRAEADATVARLKSAGHPAVLQPR
ncbi:MAG: SPOR domain-containing protein [Thauera sp.]|nr:SPOR domain-containing protein [Thauera sp.]